MMEESYLCFINIDQGNCVRLLAFQLLNAMKQKLEDII